MTERKAKSLGKKEDIKTKKVPDLIKYYQDKFNNPIWFGVKMSLLKLCVRYLHFSSIRYLLFSLGSQSTCLIGSVLLNTTALTVSFYLIMYAQNKIF